MENISAIGIDIAKSVFQVHAISEAGEVVVRRQWKRRQVLGFFAAEAVPDWDGSCATAYHWARQLIASIPHPKSLPLWPRSQCLDRTHAQAELHRRQGHVG